MSSAMIAMTTSSSMSVKALGWRFMSISLVCEMGMRVWVLGLFFILQVECNRNSVVPHIYFKKTCTIGSYSSISMAYPRPTLASIWSFSGMNSA